MFWTTIVFSPIKRISFVHSFPFLMGTFIGIFYNDSGVFLGAIGCYLDYKVTFLGVVSVGNFC